MTSVTEFLSLLEGALLEWGEDSFESDYERVREDVENEWRSRKRHQSWMLVPKAKLVRLYREYGKFGRVNEDLLLDIWSILQDVVMKVIINSETKDHDMWPYGDEPDLYAQPKVPKVNKAQPEFGFDDPRSVIEPKPLPDKRVEKMRDKEWDRWFLFVSDLSGSNRVRNFAEVKGNARYSDGSRSLVNYLRAAYNATEPEKKLLAIDRLLNFAHGLGSMAGWFIEGGVRTLDEIANFAPQGMTAAGFR